MAPAARDRNISVIHRRFCIGSRQDLVRASVTVLAVCSRPARTVSAGMKAMRVGFLCVGVALCAANFLRRSVMRKALHIFVTINTSEHIAVDGMLELALVHKQTDLLAVHLRRQGGVGVACKTVFVLKLMLSASSPSTKEQR